jgi:transcriptional regulator with XRE-family HTH domain
MDARGGGKGGNRSRVLERLGRNVRGARESLGLSQERLALETGLDRTYISSLERGRRNASIVTICRIALVLHVPPVALLEGIEWADVEEGVEGEEPVV